MAVAIGNRQPGLEWRRRAATVTAALIGAAGVGACTSERTATPDVGSTVATQPAPGVEPPKNPETKPETGSTKLKLDEVCAQLASNTSFTEAAGKVLDMPASAITEENCEALTGGNGDSFFGTWSTPDKNKVVAVSVGPRHTKLGDSLALYQQTGRPINGVENGFYWAAGGTTILIREDMAILVSITDRNTESGLPQPTPSSQQDSLTVAQTLI